MATVSLDALTAACLTDGALYHLWEVVCSEDDQGCCPGCCRQCWAIRQLNDAGQLDGVLRPFAAQFRGELWVDDDHGGVDRALLARAWARPCAACGRRPPTGRVVATVAAAG
jgi:hypothetical protein